MAVTRIGRPTAIGDLAEWGYSGGSGVPSVVDPGDPLVHDDDATYIFRNSGASIGKHAFVITTLKPMSAVLSVSFGVRMKIAWIGSAENLIFYAKLRGVTGAQTVISATEADVWQTSIATLPRPGGGAWSVDDVRDPTLQLFVENPTALNGAARVSSLWIQTSCEAVPIQLGQAREIGSRRLLAFRRESARISPTVRAELLDAELLDDVGVAHYAIPLHNALGGGAEVWQRIPHRVMRLDFDLENMVVVPELKDIRGQLVQFWDAGRSMKTSGPTEDGIARLDQGSTRLLTRASRAWVPNPTEGLVHQCEDGELKLDAEGQLFESARTNGLTRSSFVSGLTGWSTVRVTAVSTADGDSLFEPGITPWRAVLASDGVGSGSAISPASVSYAANTKISVSVDYRELQADTAMIVRISRGVDGRYWNGTTWQVGTFNLTVPASLVKARALWENIDVGTSATTITVQVAVVVLSRTAHCYHVQVEAGAWASSRIVTDASTVTRARDELKISNSSGARCFNRDRGTVMLEYRPEFANPAAGAIFSLFDVTYDASNYFRFFYEQGAGLKFQVAVAGTAYTAVVASFAPIRGTTYRLAARWSSASTELGSAHTLSAFVDGVQGVDAVATGMPTEAQTSDLYVGGNAALTLSAEGVVRAIVHTQQVLTNAEIVRGF